VSHEQEPGKSFFDTLRGAVVSSVPALSALVFVVVAIKVFRASMMETTTTVAIVSTADLVALLKGVILTLLPGFLAALTAASIWWWAGVLPERLAGDDAPAAARRALFSPQAAFAWAMTVTAFLTIWWPIFLLLFVPVLATTVALLRRSHARTRRPIAPSRPDTLGIAHSSAKSSFAIREASSNGIGGGRGSAYGISVGSGDFGDGTYIAKKPPENPAACAAARSRCSVGSPRQRWRTRSL